MAFSFELKEPFAGASCACVRFASVRCRDCSLRTVAIAARADDAFAGIRTIKRIARITGFGFFAITTAVAVGNGVAGASAFIVARIVFLTVFARTVAADVLTRRTA